MTYQERLNKLIQGHAYLELGLSIRTEVRNNCEGRLEINSDSGNVWTFTHSRYDFGMTVEVLCEYVYHKLVEAAIIDSAIKVRDKQHDRAK